MQENYATQFVVQRLVTFFEGEQSSLQSFYQFLGILVQDGTSSSALGILGFTSLNNTLISTLTASNSLSFALARNHCYNPGPRIYELPKCVSSALLPLCLSPKKD